ncbi:SDR family NAD(P)-dependent oxidoreductase [Arthrobacter sp. ZGTC131]|uniref:SDR family NAD(P)-dependent oxidoreductase n=1 Tax=Arthrobacter sp. ZGTC131 TaxID=2058898 RepID=UPI0021588CC5|nr:SDR family NAD(P)-dependent oxidoreductase [Arthrobacter sp. ZGTC131]
MGRDPKRTEETARAIRLAGGGKVDTFVADLSSQAQVRRLADELLTLPRIDALINNAGGYWNTRHTTADGIEHTFALNHLAPFLLTNLLLERLQLDGPARVITVSSNAQARGASTLRTFRASAPIPVPRPTTSPNSRTCCSPTNWPEDWKALQ